VIIERARAHDMAGASVYPVEMGFGAHHQVHDLRNEYSSFDIPLVVELVDLPERVQSFRVVLQDLVREGLATFESVTVRGCGNLNKAPAAQGGEVRLLENSLMEIAGKAQRLTIYVGSSDTWHGKNVSVEILERCRRLSLAGATVARGIMGFGKTSRVHRTALLGLSEDLPERIEIIDTPEQIEKLLVELEEVVSGGLIVCQDVEVVRYTHSPSGPSTRKS
jgi:PII-like signaling protein